MAKKNAKDSDIERDSASGAGALVAAIAAKLAEQRDPALMPTIDALQQVLRDWQRNYATLDAQLTMALAVNEQLNALVRSLREEVRDAQARAYQAEQRVLKAGPNIASERL